MRKLTFAILISGLFGLSACNSTSANNQAEGHDHTSCDHHHAACEAHDQGTATHQHEEEEAQTDCDHQQEGVTETKTEATSACQSAKSCGGCEHSHKH